MFFYFYEKFSKIISVLFTVENLLEFVETPLDFKQLAVKSAAAGTNAHAVETFFHSTPLPTLLKFYLVAISLLIGLPSFENLISYSVITLPSFISLL